MKAVFVAALLLFAGTSYAGEFTSVQKSGEFTSFAGEFTSFSKIQFQSGPTWIPSNKVCHHNGFLYHMTKSSITVEQCQGDNGCTLVQKSLHPQPVVSSRLVCAHRGGRGDSCLKWERVPFVQEPVTKLEVYRSKKDLENSGRPVKSQTFAMPNCF